MITICVIDVSRGEMNPLDILDVKGGVKLNVLVKVLVKLKRCVKVVILVILTRLASSFEALKLKLIVVEAPLDMSPTKICWPIIGVYSLLSLTLTETLYAVPAPTFDNDNVTENIPPGVIV
jgi:hypothetical protein